MVTLISLEGDFRKFIREGSHLFREHERAAGHPPGAWLGLNWPVIDMLAGQGRFVVVVGRGAGGEMRGYAVTLVTPDLLKPRLIGALVMLFALPMFPLLGLRLARRSRDHILSSGCEQFLLQSTNESPDSQRMSILARALGGTPLSSFFSVGAI